MHFKGMMTMVGHQQTNQKNVETENVDSNEQATKKICKMTEKCILIENNNLLLYSSFPFLFLFGKGLIHKQCGSVDKKAARLRTLLQFNA